MPEGLLTEVIAQIIAAVPQAALAVLFGLFALTLLLIMLKVMEKRDDKFLATLKDLQTAHLVALEKRDIEWRTYIADIQNRGANGLGRVADEVKVVAERVAAVGAQLAQHDTWARISVEQRRSGPAPGA